MAWLPPPSQVAWDMPVPLVHGHETFTTLTLRAPTAADVMKATAVPGASGMQVTLRLIGIIAAEEPPFEALLQLQSWQVEQMTSYIDLFNGAPLPGPLAEYQAAVRAANSVPSADPA